MSLRICLADHNPAIREIVIEMLSGRDEVVGVCADRESVLSQASILLPDVIILEISMPEMNGLEITRRLKQMKCPSHIVFLTTHENQEFVIAARNIGASGYVFKSRLHIDLLRAIKAVAKGKTFFPSLRHLT